MEVAMFARLSLLALALIAVAGAASARTIYRPAVQVAPIVDNRSPPAGPHRIAITDEYGFHYDRWGNRLNGAGHVVAPPHTMPGATVIQNGGQS
jgi:hypothetical protein